MNDIVTAQQIRVLNNTSHFIDDPEIKKYYTYDYFVQLTLSTVNGISVKKVLEKIKQDSKFSKPKAPKNKVKKKAMADVFFRFSHRDRNNVALTNK